MGENGSSITRQSRDDFFRVMDNNITQLLGFKLSTIMSMLSRQNFTQNKVESFGPDHKLIYRLHCRDPIYQVHFLRRWQWRGVCRREQPVSWHG